MGEKMNIVKFLSLYEVWYEASCNLALPFPCVYRATAVEFKQKKPPSKIISIQCYDNLAGVHFKMKYS